MCICIYKPSDKILSEEALRNCSEINSDGGGFAYASEGKLCIQKGFFDFKEFWAAFNLIQKDNPAVVHFRIKTSGNKDADNCHPWLINENCCVLHNGILGDFVETDSPKSDTGHFVTNILQPLLQSGDVFKDEWVLYLITKVVGENNKLVFFNQDGEVCIINQEKGINEEKIWYSNSSFRTTSNKQQDNSVKVKVINGSNKKKHGYILVGRGITKPLEGNEIHQLSKKYRCNTKGLVSKGIITRIELSQHYHNNEAEALANWHAKNAALNGLPIIGCSSK